MGEDEGRPASASTSLTQEAHKRKHESEARHRDSSDSSDSDSSSDSEARHRKKHRREKKEKKEKKKKDKHKSSKGKKEKHKKHKKEDVVERSIISGKPLLKKLDKTDEDHARDAKRQQLLAFLNDAY